MSETAPNARRGLHTLGGILVLSLGLFASYAAESRGGVDFPSMHLMGRGIIEGTNVYAPEHIAVFPERFGVSRPPGLFYPPATGVMLAPFALLPYSVGKACWFIVMTAVLVLGIRALVRIIRPTAGEWLWMVVAGGVLVSATLRWSMMLLQAAPLLAGLLCWLAVLLHQGRMRAAFVVAAVAMALKMTLALPFLGLLALYRRYGAAVACVVSWGVLNAAGFARMGSGAFASYQANMATVEAMDQINAPDPWRDLALPRLDWAFLFYGLGGSLLVARVLTLALTLVVALVLLREGLRAARPPGLSEASVFLAALVALGSLCVYHHQYDLCVFVAPVIAIVLGPSDARRPGWALLLASPLVLMATALPIGLTQGLLVRVFGASGAGILKLSFPIATSAALAGFIVLLSRTRAPKRFAPPVKVDPSV